MPEAWWCVAGEADAQGGHRGQVRDAIRRVSAQDRQEDGGHPALQVHLRLLRKGPTSLSSLTPSLSRRLTTRLSLSAGEHEAHLRRHLEVQVVQEDRRRRRLRLQVLFLLRFCFF